MAECRPLKSHQDYMKSSRLLKVSMRADYLNRHISQPPRATIWQWDVMETRWFLTLMVIERVMAALLSNS